MLLKIQEAIRRIDALRGKPIKIVSHFDTDGVASAAIFSRAMARWGKLFSLEIVKSLDKSFIHTLPNDRVLIFLDLASNSFEYLKEKKTEVFVFDHHEVLGEIPANVCMVNSVLESEESLSSAAICYLFAKALSARNRNLAHLAVIGMIGDLHEKYIGKFFNEILYDSEANVKKGLLLYPSTRPLNFALEYSSHPYIPGVTGSRQGVLDLLRDAAMPFENGKYKALYELSDNEMTRLITAIMLHGIGRLDQDDLIGNLYLIRFFSKLEDAREISALINACSRMGFSDVALGFCLGNKGFREHAEKIYNEYRRSLMSALQYVSETDKITGENYLIINARDKIKDTIIGTVASILSHSPLYPEGLVIIALSYNDEKIKVSARLAGRKGRNVREVLHRAVVPFGGEVGGHPQAAGCLISKEKEKEFICELRKVLDVELV